MENEGNSGEQGEPNGEPAPNGQQPQPNPDGGQNTATQFSQADVDRIVQERLARASKGAQAKVLNDLGFDNATDAKALADQLKSERESKLLDEKKYQELLDIRQTENAALTTQLATEQAYRRTETARRVINQAANIAGALHPEQVASLVANSFKIADDGSVNVVDGQGAVMTDGKGGQMTPEAFMQGWLEKNPHFKKAASGQGSGTKPNSGGNAGGNPPKANAPLDLERVKSGDTAYMRENRQAIIDAAQAGLIKL